MFEPANLFIKKKKKLSSEVEGRGGEWFGCEYLHLRGKHNRRGRSLPQKKSQARRTPLKVTQAREGNGKEEEDSVKCYYPQSMSKDNAE